MRRMVDGPISVDAVLDAVRRPEAGAVALFLGTVRDHHDGRPVEGLGYDAHTDLAATMLDRLAVEAGIRFDVVEVAIVHRTGELAIGDISVAVAVSSAHRADAFAAARFLIDTLKRTVPIWKRERFADGAVWIEGDQRIPTDRDQA